MIKILIVTITALCFIHPNTVTADTIYKWKDEKGSWHFSDTPPQNNDVVNDLKISKYEQEVQTEDEKRTQIIEEYNHRNTQIKQEYAATATGINRKYQKRIEKIEDKYNDQKEARLKARIKEYNDKIDIRDSKEKRDYYRRKRDEYKEQLKIHQRYN